MVSRLFSKENQHIIVDSLASPALQTGRPPATVVTKRATERSPNQTTRSVLHASLRNRVHRASRPERAGARDGRALSRDGREQERADSPPGRLGTTPARV